MATREGDDAEAPHLPSSLNGVSRTELTKQQTLFLKNRQITDSDCEAIAHYLQKNGSLRQLYIGYNTFGDDGTRHLCKALAQAPNSQLELLGLRHCSLGDVAAQAVSELITTSKTLIEVGVDENQIGDAGAQAIAEAIANNKTLAHLYIGMNSLTEDGKAKLLGSAPPQLQIHFSR